MSVGETIIAIMLFSFPPLFLAWVFVRGVGCSSCIFFLVFQKNKCAAVCGLTKTMTKKGRATPHSSPPLGLQAVPVRWASSALLFADIYNLLLGFIPNAKNSNQ